MPLTLDPIARKKLVLVKQIYQRALVDSKGILSKTSRILSVIEFDLAIETVLKVIVSVLDTSKLPESDTTKLINQTNTLLNSAGIVSIPDEAHIRFVRKIRNNAQHQAIYPNETDVSDCRIYTRDFLNLITKHVWGIEFESIALADLVEDIEIRNLLADATVQYDLENYSKSVDLISEAMDKTMNFIESSVVGGFPNFVSGIAVTDSFRMGRDESIVRDDRHFWEEREVLDSIKKMRETLFYLALDIKISDLIRFRKLVGYTYFTMDNKFHRHNGKKDINKEDVEFLLAYSVDTIIKIEEQVGSLRNPYE